LRTICIKIWQSEPYQQKQNPTERFYQSLKAAVNHIMDCTGAPPKTWLLCLNYVCFILNHTFNKFPWNQLTGNTVDISVHLCFHFWKKVYYKSFGKSICTQQKKLATLLVFFEHCGHVLTWKILTTDTNVIIFDPFLPIHYCRF
jgi:hypothetical protein